MTQVAMTIASYFSTHITSGCRQGRQSSVGTVKVEVKKHISMQLLRNVNSKASGPGIPTAISIHSKFITIGTSRSMVLVFDHFEELHQILKPATRGETDGPVTAIDVSSGSDYLVCGYRSGKVVLWDIMKGTSLKASTDMHMAPITGLRFCRFVGHAPFVCIFFAFVITKWHHTQMASRIVMC